MVCLKLIGSAAHCLSALFPWQQPLDGQIPEVHTGDGKHEKSSDMSQIMPAWEPDAA